MDLNQAREITKQLNEQLDLQRKILQAEESTNKSFSTYIDAKKSAVEATLRLKLVEEELKKIQETRNKLEKEILGTTSKELKLKISEVKNSNKTLANKEKELEVLNEQLNILTEIEDQEKSISDRLKEQRTSIDAIRKSTNIWKASLNSVSEWAKNFMSSNFSPRQIYNDLMDWDKAIRTSQVSLGLSGQEADNMRKSVEQASWYAARFGIDVKELSLAQKEYGESLGRSVVLSEQNYNSIVLMSKGLNQSVSEATNMAVEFEKIGLGIDDTKKIMEGVLKTSNKTGLSASKLAKTFTENVKLQRQMNFQSGVKGILKLSELSLKLKNDLSYLPGLTEKLFRPEGAIETAANLQILGGALGRLGDPMQLMLKARTAPEELAESIGKATQSYVQFDKKTGSFKMNAMGLDQMREAAQATGISMETLVQQGEEMAKQSKVKMSISSSIPNDLKELLANKSTFKDGKAVVQINGNTVAVSQVTKEMAQTLRDQEVSLEKAAQNSVTFDESWKNTVLQLKTTLLPLLKRLDTFTKFLSESPGWAKFLGIGLISFVAVVPMLLKAASLFAQFKTANKTSGILDKITGSGGSVSSTSSDIKTSGKGGGLGKSVSSFGSAATILSIGVSMMMLAKSVDMFADAALKIKKNDLGGVMVGLGVGLGLFIGVLGLLGASGIGEIGVAIIIGIGAGMLMLGGAVWLASEGMSSLVDSFSGLFTSIGGQGTEFMNMAMGMGVLTASVFGLGIALSSLVINPLTWLGMTMLGGMVDKISNVSGGGLKSTVDSINQLDQSKIDTLKSLADAASSGKPIMIEFKPLEIDGDINLSGNGKEINFEGLLNNRKFVDSLRDKIIDSINTGKSLKSSKPV